MSQPSSVREWLAEFQGRFSNTIRSPLDPSTGSFQGTGVGSDALAALGVRAGPRASAEESLRTYQMQFWLRVFSVFQGEFPCLNAVIGPWSLNGLATGFVINKPRSDASFDIRDITAGFVVWLERSMTTQTPGDRRANNAAVAEAAALDEAFGAVTAAPEARPFCAVAGAPNPTRLTLSPGVALAKESWDLVGLRHRALHTPPEHSWDVGPRLPETRDLLIVRTPRGVAALNIEPLQAQLYHLVASYPLAEAVTRLSNEAKASAQPELSASLREWMQRAAELGIFEIAE